MRPLILTRLAVLAAGVAIVASCDTRAATMPEFGGSGGSSSSSGSGTSNGNGPSIVIDSPRAGALVNVGDSVLVTVTLRSQKSLHNATISGVRQTGSVDLGTFSQTDRYKPIVVPPTGSFRPGLKDTTIRRYLQPINPADTAVDSLVVIVTATDSLGAADTARTRINLVSGPKVSVTAPSNGDSIPAGVGLSVSARATHPDGVGRIDIRVQGESNWPTKLDTTITQVYTNAPRDITFSSVARIPINAPVRGRITITASAVDVNRQPGSSAPVTAYVRSSTAAIPRVTQTVSGKSEYADSVKVSATGDGISLVGLIIRDSTGTTIQTDSVKLPSPYNANVQTNIALNLPPTLQGMKLGITAFAVDQAGRIGYAVPLAHAAAEGNVANALIDSTLVVYGRTYALPQQGTIGDIAVDAARGNVFLSNTEYNLLDVWQSSASSKGFSSSAVAVGSLPWGMTVSNNPDTLLVANSGGTNISRVFIGSTNAGQLHEDLAHRILTRNTYVYVVTFQQDQTTGKVRISLNGPFSYSDRPQYISQSAGGRIFYSTRPTATAPAGTIRWLDPSPKLKVPDPRQIWQYGKYLPGTQVTYAVFNVDSIGLAPADPSSKASDELYVWDHPYGDSTGVLTAVDSTMNGIVGQLCTNPDTTGSHPRCPPVPGSHESDIEAVLNLDVSTLPLTDTTFTAASGNRNWVAFGEGHTGGAGRVVMVQDPNPAANEPSLYSPLVTISDLTDNASEQVFGLALDYSGNTVGSHGLQSYFATVDDPFHLRLQGKYDSFDDGAGIAFHPNADGVTTPQDKRLAFVAAASGQIEVVDIAYYINRARLMLKNPIYGPLRASLPMPGDPSDVIMKLYAVSQQGLVVIDLTAKDIKAGP